MKIIGRRKLWYAISTLLILPGLISLATHGLRLGIDFTGGSTEVVQGSLSRDKFTKLSSDLGFTDVVVTPESGNRTSVRFSDKANASLANTHHNALKARLAQAGFTEIQFSNVGPVVSKDITRNAIVAIAVVSLAIVIYIGFAFRNAPPPVKPVSFGIATIIALLHDALFLIGLFSILGWLFKVEVDALFVTAVLTVIGFSVHDTIVVFDRVRENLRRERKPFDEIVNDSVNQTFARSLNTSMTVLLVLLALYLFGGESIKLFVLALLAGIASGTYSSIFNASPLLVTYHNWQTKRKRIKLLSL